MQAGLRDVVSLPLSLEQLEASVRAAAQWSRTLRERVAGEESAAGALGGRLIGVAGAKGGVGTTTVALQLALAAIRAMPGRPVCVVDFDMQKGDLRSFLDLPHRRSVVDLVEVAAEISVRHLQETLYTHNEGFRVLLAPEEGERGEEIDSGVARAVLNAVKARHALTVVDLGAQVSEAGAIGAEIANGVVDRHDARRRRAARRPAPARPVAAARGARRRRGPHRAQPRLAQARDPARPRAQGRRSDAGPDDDPGRLRRVRDRVNTGSPVRSRTASCAARSTSSPSSWASCPAPRSPRARAARGAACSRASAGSAARRAPRRWGCSRAAARSCSPSGSSASIGYTYVLAGHAAQEGARIMAVNPTDGKPDDAAYKKIRARAMGEVPKAWRGGAEVDASRTTSRPSPSALKVPVVLPGLRTPFAIGSRAATAIEDEDAAAVAGDHPGAGVVTPALARAAGPGLGRVHGRWSSGCCSPRCSCGSCMLAAWTVNQATNSARTASRVAARPGGDPEKAGRNARLGSAARRLPRLPPIRGDGHRAPAGSRSSSPA